jgi:hypothetical protein
LKKLIIIFTFFIFANSNAQIEGTFKHKICAVGPNCFVYQLFKDGTFKYIYHQDILGSGELKGKYIKVSDTLKLTPDKVIFSKESKLIEQEYWQKDFSKIAIIFQRATEKGKEDTQFWEWYVSVNDGEFIKTDSQGSLLIPRTKINKIQICDALAYEVNRSEPDAFIKLVTSVFYPVSDKNGFEVYAAEDGTNMDLAITNLMTKIFSLKGSKLIPVTFEPEEAYLGKNKTFYEKQ